MNCIAPSYQLHQWWRDRYLPWPNNKAWIKYFVKLSKQVISCHFNHKKCWAARRLRQVNKVEPISTTWEVGGGKHSFTRSNVFLIDKYNQYTSIKWLTSWPTCNSGNANDSNEAKSTLYLPTVGHLKDSGLHSKRCFSSTKNVDRDKVTEDAS